MVNLEEPFTFENSSNPWLMDKRDDSDVLIGHDGKKLTAAHLWEMDEKERVKALNFVFKHYRANGFPKIVLSEKRIDSDFKKLCALKTSDVLTKDGFVSNSGNLCIDLCKMFSQKFFYEAKGRGNKTFSVKEVFDSDELLMRVLKNRMGWNSTKEDGSERPYMFPISDKQLLNGIRNSGLGYAVSNFRPSIAKWMYAEGAALAGISEGVKAKVFDYSGGWCARAMGALSLGYDYDATDPLTAGCIENCVKRFKLSGQSCNVFNKGSEDAFFKDPIFAKAYDVVGSCPPYFDMEIYSEQDKKQSVNVCPEYFGWLNLYWKGTVKNCISMMKDNGVFILVMKEIVDEHAILKDMLEIANTAGLHEVKRVYYKTTTNHLSGKTKTGRSTKTNEAVVFLKKTI